MANPALKNGYISIAVELVEKLASINIPGQEMRIIWVVWRKTWGWSEGARKKDWDWISLSQFEGMTRMKHQNVVAALESLVVKRLLLKREKGYKFNQNYDEWVVVKRLPPPKSSSQTTTRGSSQTTTKTSSQTTTNNRYIDRGKDIPPSEGEGPPKFTTLGAEVIKLFESINPACKNYYSRAPQRQAADDLIGERGFDKVKTVIQNTLPKTNSIEFFPTITTPIQLREKWTMLESAVQRYKSKAITKKQSYII